MTNETHNGWSNRETWLVALWLNNDEATQATAREVALGGVDNLRELVEEMTEGNPASLTADLLGQALNRVDWQAVVEGLTEE